MKRYQKGVGTVVEWVKVRAWNEDFDLSVYCLAALYILGPSYVATIGANPDTHAPVPPAMREKPPATEQPRPALPQPRAPRSNWVTKGSSWKSRW